MMISHVLKKSILILLKNSLYQLIEIINKAYIMTGKTQLKLEKLDYPNKYSDSIFICIWIVL